jgi:hypothetical protein
VRILTRRAPGLCGRGRGDLVAGSGRFGTVVCMRIPATLAVAALLMSSCATTADTGGDAAVIPAAIAGLTLPDRAPDSVEAVHGGSWVLHFPGSDDTMLDDYLAALGAGERPQVVQQGQNIRSRTVAVDGWTLSIVQYRGAGMVVTAVPG